MFRRQQHADRALRPAMRSPGRPMPARHVEREFWRLIGQGRRTEDAALQVGVSTPVASRWFCHAGGMPPLSLAEPTGRYLSFHEREDLAVLKAGGLGVRAIACELERDPGTISRDPARERCDPQQQNRVSGQRRAVEGADRRAAPQAGEAREQFAAAGVCPNAAQWQVAAARRDGCGGASDNLEGLEQAPSWGPSLGEGLESGADQPTARRRLPRRCAHAHQPRGDLPGALHPRPGRAPA